MDAMAGAVAAEMDPATLAEPFSLVEIFRNLPHHIEPNGDATFAWYVCVSAAGVDVGPGSLPDPDLRILMTHAVAVKLGRLAYEDAASLAMRDDIYALAASDGSVTFEGDAKLPPLFAAALLRAHNRMAPQTL